jgi:hypothetical protein
MESENMEKHEIEIDKIIDQSLVDFKEELDKSDFKNSSEMAIQSFLETSLEKYISKSTAYIYKKFPDVEKTNQNEALQNVANNNSRAILYLYAAKRNNEFTEIQNEFIDNLN